VSCADPTIKYFNGDTGEGGEKYNGGRDKDSLVKFVQESLGAKCLLDDTEACTEKEIGYIEKMKGNKDEAAKQLERLKGMKSNAMAPELKKWLNQRLAILEQVVAA
jgi:protein disulfide-isomerase A6